MAKEESLFLSVTIDDREFKVPAKRLSVEDYEDLLRLKNLQSILVPQAENVLTHLKGEADNLFQKVTYILMKKYTWNYWDMIRKN